MQASDDLVKARTTEVDTLQDTLSTNLKRITDMTPSAAANLAGARDSIATAKVTVEAGLSRLAHINNDIDSATAQLTQTGKKFGATYSESKQTVDTLQKEVASNQKLLDLRKAQAMSLKEKYAADNHTSYLGLWRPLMEDTRFLLLILSVLLVIGVAVSLYFYPLALPAAVSTLPLFGSVPAAKPVGATTNFFGGALRRLFPRRA